MKEKEPKKSLKIRLSLHTALKTITAGKTAKMQEFAEAAIEAMLSGKMPVDEFIGLDDTQRNVAREFVKILKKDPEVAALFLELWQRMKH